MVTAYFGGWKPIANGIAHPKMEIYSVESRVCDLEAIFAADGRRPLDMTYECVYGVYVPTPLRAFNCSV